MNNDDAKEFNKLAAPILEPVSEGVTMEYYDGSAVSPSVAVAHTADSEMQALDFADELKEVIAKGFPAWRGWGVYYAKKD